TPPASGWATGRFGWRTLESVAPPSRRFRSHQGGLRAVVDSSTVCVVDSHPRSRRALRELLALRHPVRTYAAIDAFLDDYSLELSGCLLIDAAGSGVLESLRRLQ